MSMQISFTHRYNDYFQQSSENELLEISSVNIECKTGIYRLFKQYLNFTSETGRKNWNLTFQWRIPLQIYCTH